MAAAAALRSSRWMVLAAAMWLQSVAGVGYLFGALSPAVKAAMGYDQRQLAVLGIAKDLGDNIGLPAGMLAGAAPMWAVIAVGAALTFSGYGGVWLAVAGRAPALSLPTMCVLIFLGTNGESFFNAAALVSSLQSFPDCRGPIVGILNGFSGLSTAILSQLYSAASSSSGSPSSSLILMVAVGPSAVALALMFIVRPVSASASAAGGKANKDKRSFQFMYAVCLVVAGYLLAVMLVQDLFNVGHTAVVAFTVVLLSLLLLPLAVALLDAFRTSSDREERLIIIADDESVPEPAVKLPADSEMNRRRPKLGEDFTLAEALASPDFWLIFISCLVGASSGLTVIDNLGQLSQSLGYTDSNVFVSLMSIWNFLGRFLSGCLSELVVRGHGYPRHAALTVAQVLMAAGHLILASGGPAAMYAGTFLVGLAYGAHWAVVPAAASELFGLKNFGAISSFITIANPAGTFVFSGVIASRIYDYEAARQARSHLGGDAPAKCRGSACFFLSEAIMSGFCVAAAALSLLVVRRTRRTYEALYGRAAK